MEKIYGQINNKKYELLNEDLNNYLIESKKMQDEIALRNQLSIQKQEAKKVLADKLGMTIEQLDLLIG